MTEDKQEFNLNLQTVSDLCLCTAGMAGAFLFTLDKDYGNRFWGVEINRSVVPNEWYVIAKFVLGDDHTFKAKVELTTDEVLQHAGPSFDTVIEAKYVQIRSQVERELIRIGGQDGNTAPESGTANN